MAEKSINSNSKDNKLISLFEATAKETGKKFFEALILNLANALNTYGAWANVYNEDQSKAKSLAFLIAGELLPDFEYEIKGTPCETVINNDTLHHVPDNLIEIYPDDPEIKEGLKKPLSYLGVPIKDNSGNIIGNLGVLDCEPMPANPRSLEIFNLFASRATAELQRLKSDIENKDREEKIERLLDSTLEAIIELDQDMTVNMVNASAERMFLCPSNHFIGKNFSEFLSNESAEQLSSLKSQLDSFPVGKRHLTVNNGLNVRKVDETGLKVEASLSEFYLGSCIYYTLILKDTQDTGDNIKFFNQCKYETAVFNDNIRETTVSNEITGTSILMLKLFEDIKKVAPTGSTVLITGETGTGKELIARAIHNQSGNNNAPLIKVNCAAIPASLIESEFFGHEKGAFTGATSKRKGRFSLADGGTIFLDEIGELPLELQSKLLRVLQEGEFEPVGGSETIKVDVRVVTATNRNLSEEVKKGNFREDLYYRLNVFPVSVPPLRDRGNDIILLAEKYAQSFSLKSGIPVKPINNLNIKCMLSYAWPGNVRELQNVIERAVITSEEGELNIEIPQTEKNISSEIPENIVNTEKKILTAKEIQQIEIDNILKALDATDWKVSGENGAAKLLGIPPTTLSSKIKAFGLKRSNN